MLSSRFALGLLFVCAGAAPVSAASFPCSKATTPQEKAICSNAKLSALDEQVAAAYKRLRAQLSSEGAMKVQTDQREWLAWLRLTCPDRAANKQAQEVASCLKTNYSERLRMLEKGLQHAGGMVFFPRLKVLVMPDTEQPEPGSSDPGFGKGTFSWPEIDHPTPQQAAWNMAVRAQVVGMSTEVVDGKKEPQDFTPESVAESDVNVGYILQAANEKFIAVDLDNETYGYGAAHPNEYGVSFFWLLDKQRLLKPEDIFRPGSGWDVFLAKQSYSQLRKSDNANGLYEEAEVRKAAADVVKDPKSWNLDSQQLEIDFPEYSVAPRAAGEMSAEFLWKELKPYLASGFDPATLPKPLTSPKP